jgi:hypothetical protein
MGNKKEGYARREAFGIDDGAAVDILRALVLFNHRKDVETEYYVVISMHLKDKSGSCVSFSLWLMPVLLPAP